jgi:hypothetical protein
MAVITQIQAPSMPGSSYTNVATSLTYTFSSPPTAGDIVIVNGVLQTAGGTMAISDLFGDTGGTAWAITPNINAFTMTSASYNVTQWWRQIGSGATLKTVTLSGWSSGFNAQMDAGEWASSDAGNWGVDGTPVAANGGPGTTQTAGNITTSGHSLIVGESYWTANTTGTQGSGYTKSYFSTAPNIFSQGNEWGEFDSISGQAVNWTTPSNVSYTCTGAAFVKTSSFTAVNRRSTGPRVGSRSYY